MNFLVSYQCFISTPFSSYFVYLVLLTFCCIGVPALVIPRQCYLLLVLHLYLRRAGELPSISNGLLLSGLHWVLLSQPWSLNVHLYDGCCLCQNFVSSASVSLLSHPSPDSKTLVGHRWLWVAKCSLWATTEPLVAHWLHFFFKILKHYKQL